MASRNWVCPFCNRPQTLTDGQYSFRSTQIRLKEHKFGNIGTRHIAYACANAECAEVTLELAFGHGDGDWGDFKFTDAIESYSLRPASSERPQPGFIPEALRADYSEACRIRDLSPKASATLSRRCLQGMIRDFCGIAKSRLIDEIKELRKQLDDHTAAKGVTHESVDAIDAVRSVGNIGAHMEKDVNLIIDIEPGEAQMLIELIEMLFDEWYVERQRRDQKLKDILALSKDKAQMILDAKSNNKPDAS